MRGPTWTKEEEGIVRENAGKLSFAEIGEMIGRSPLAVQLFMFRNHIASRKVLRRPIIKLLLRRKFVDESWFSPNKAFYEQIEMSARRFQDLAAGYKQPTQGELSRIRKVLNVSSKEMQEIQEATQLFLFDK